MHGYLYHIIHIIMAKSCVRLHRNFNVTNQVTETRDQQPKSTLTTTGYLTRATPRPQPGPFNLQAPTLLFSQGPPPADLMIRPHTD